MEQMQIGRQMIRSYKAAFDSSLQAIQEQNEKTINMFLEQAPWLPQESRQFVNEWIKAIHVVEKQVLSLHITMLASF